jgi:uncharacterized membrane protein
MDADTLVRDYLGRLEAASWPLAAERRRELASEVREHIETALAEAGRRDEVTVRNVLERLGRPEESVAAEDGAAKEPPTAADAASASAQESKPVQATSPWGAVEIGALLLLTVGAVLLPVVGPLLGLVFVWISTQWTTRQKAIATIIVVALLVLPVLGLFAASAGTTI